MGSWRGLGVGCDKLDFDSIWVFTIECVVVWATGIGIPAFVQVGEPSRFCPLCDLVNVSSGLGMKGKMIQPDSFAMVAGANVLCWSLNKAQIGHAILVTHSLRPALRLVVTKAGEEGRPELKRAFQVRDVQLDVMKHADRGSLVVARIVLRGSRGERCGAFGP